ncbi:Cocaine esterase [Cyphellophora attinorum]|uniref:Carboxylic ester hydrolase n=1 Tax=Cyphellophora attinorum TaxID=1664694 RepID=A0A0N1HHS3_9EURO|nr:Cocaine esterase [Phialophora attinorum]KPI35427.1 Cocaine esterase [Phialophora attinorum]
MSPALALVAALLSPLTAAHPTASSPSVTIDSGVVIGVTEPLLIAPDVSVTKFLGIPFADEPVRWSPPQPATPWPTPLAATTVGPACIQEFPYPEAYRARIMRLFNTPNGAPAPEESEDCLSLNVFAPPSAVPGSNGWHDWSDSNEPLPVLFWIYGGSLRFGYGGSPAYDGSNLAAQNNVIVVTINYRTNIFGFPGASILPKGEQNLGYLDQRLALDWVQRNIAQFGGDPTKVTIFGESAGALSIDALLTQAPTNDAGTLPFRAAILESGTGSLRSPIPDFGFWWKNASLTLGCGAAGDDLECMRALPATTIKDAIERNIISTWPPVPDNVTFAEYPRQNRLDSTAADLHDFARVPILIGSNAEEGRLYSIDVTSLYAYINASFPNPTNNPAISSLVQTLNETYTAVSTDPFISVAALVTDSTFQCPAAIVGRETAQVGVPTYRYYYNASFPNLELFPRAGVWHSSEVPVVFETFPQGTATQWQKDLSAGIGKIWADFAREPATGGGGDLPGLPELAVLGGGARAENGDSDRGDGQVVKVVGGDVIGEVDARCGIWEAVYDARCANGVC